MLAGATAPPWRVAIERDISKKRREKKKAKKKKETRISKGHENTEKGVYMQVISRRFKSAICRKGKRRSRTITE
jgi:hypothetical protein